jgi:hypothetical protein
VHADVILTGLQEEELLEHLVIVITGQNVVQVDLDKADLEL